jgi:hypothetical protein
MLGLLYSTYTLHEGRKFDPSPPFSLCSLKWIHLGLCLVEAYMLSHAILTLFLSAFTPAFEPRTDHHKKHITN